MAEKKAALRRFWVVNNKYPDAVTAVTKMAQARVDKADVVELTDSEFNYLGNQEACRWIVEDE